MPPWLLVWIARFASGERFRKATPAELRWYSGFFVFIPIFSSLFVLLGHSLLDRAGPVGIWFYVMGCLLVAGACLAVWARFIPATVSWIVGAIVWLIALGLAFTGK